MIKYINGDIVEIFMNGGDVAHGCNCWCTMGAGVAGLLAKAHPQILKNDKRTDPGDYSKLGDYTSTYRGDALCYNLYTQYDPGPNVNYGAIFNAFSKLARVRRNNRPLYIPKIGAGIAGGDWELIEKLINLAAPNLEIIVVLYEGVEPNNKPKALSESSYALLETL